MAIRILIFGRNGQVARELARISWPRSVETILAGRAECDLAEVGAAERMIGAAKPTIIINAAAYTAVDLAEKEAEAARRLNADAPAEIARAAASHSAKLIHLSTDYVFDGEGSAPWRETDPCRPLSVYGSTKLSGEEAIRSALAEHVIVRTSWVFSPHGANFVKTMLRLGRTRDDVAIVGDQIGGPTAAADIAQAAARIAAEIVHGKKAYGTYHFAGAPDTSWHGFARAIFERAAKHGLRVPSAVREITTVEYPTPARRPFNSRLDCAAIARDWGIARPCWEKALDTCIDLLAKEPVPS
jgi:dTDP-4-dehydrorhamnose reductase